MNTTGQINLIPMWGAPGAESPGPGVSLPASESPHIKRISQPARQMALSLLTTCSAPVQASGRGGRGWGGTRRHMSPCLSGFLPPRCRLFKSRGGKRGGLSAPAAVSQRPHPGVDNLRSRVRATPPPARHERARSRRCPASRMW